MATLRTAINSISFPYELDTLEFYTASQGESFLLTIQVGSVAIYNASLISDEDANVVLFGFADLLNTYLKSPQTVNILLDGGLAKSTTCFPCKVAMDVDAQVFFDSHFLSRAKGDLQTYPGSIEHLSFAAEPADYSYTVHAVFFSDGSVKTQDIVSSIRMGQGEEVCTLDIAVDEIAAKMADAVLAEFTVTLGNRSQRFLVVADHCDGEHLSFTNTFGVTEHFYFPMLEVKMSPNIQAARINGKLTNYKVDNKRLITGTAEHILPAMVEVFEDLLMSPQIFLQGTTFPLTIESGEVVSSSLSQSSPTAKATWKEAKGIPFHQPTRKVRTFDATFDNTFE